MRPGAVALMPPGVLGNGLSAELRLLGGFPFYAPRTSSITQTRGAGTPTETRATVATVMGYAADATLADGQTLLTVASGELRFQGARRISEGVWSDVDAAGVPIPSATLDGSVVEAAATNLCLQSQTIGSWTIISDATVSDNAAVAPDGTTTADKLVEAATSAVHTAFNNPAITGGSTYANSIYVKAAERTWCYVSTYDGTTSTNAYFNLTTGVFGTTSGAGTFTTEASVNGWWRIVFVQTTTGGATNDRIQIATAAGNNQVNYLGDITKGIYVWGGQKELGSYATTYIPTTTAAVTRNKDVLDDQVSSNLTAAAGTVAFTWTPSHDPSGTIALCGSYVDASNYTALLHDGTKYIFRKRIAGTNYDAELTASFVSGTTYSIALKWGADGSQIAVDGVLGTANTTGIEGVQYGKLTGVAGTYFSTPAKSVTGSFRHDFDVSLPYYTPAALVTLFDSRTANTGYSCHINTNGTLWIYVGDGTGYFAAISTVSTGLTDNTRHTLSFIWTDGVGASFEIDEVVLGDSAAQAKIIAASAGSRLLGPFVGNVYASQVTQNATALEDFNPADYLTGTTWTSSATGEVHTMNGNAAVWPAVKLGTRWQWGADGNGGQQAGAAFKEMYLSPESMSDAELLTITR